MATDNKAHAHPAMYKGRNPSSRKALSPGPWGVGSPGSCKETGMASALAIKDLGRGFVGFVVQLIAVPKAARDAMRERFGPLGEGAVGQGLRGFVEQGQPLLEKLGAKVGQGDMLGHGRAGVRARAAHQR